LLVEFSISVVTTHLWKSEYTPYQEYLFNRIRGFKEHNLTPIGYRKISQIFNKEGLLTPRGFVFKNNHVHSIYKKGKIRLDRMNRKDIVEISDVIVEVLNESTWYKLWE